MAATNDTLIGIDFGGGIDQNADPKRTIATKMIELDNVRLDKGQRISKRYGMQLVTNFKNAFGGTTLTGDTLGSFGPLAMVRKASTGVLDPVYGQSTLNGSTASAAFLGPNTQISAVSISKLAGGAGNGDVTLVDSASIQDQTCYAFAATGNGVPYVAFTIVNNLTGATIAQQTSFAGVRPRVIAGQGSTFNIGFVNTTTNNLEFRSFTKAVDVIFPVAATSVVTLVNVASPHWDWAYIKGTVCFCYNSSTATTIRYGTVSGGVAASAGSFATAAAVNAICMCDQPTNKSTDDARVVWHDSISGLQVRYFESAAMTAGTTLGGANRVINATTTVVENIAATNGAEASGYTVVVAQYTAAATYNRFTITRFFADAAAIVVQSPAATQRGVGLASKLLLINQRVYGLAAFQSTLQSQYFMFEWTRQLGSTTGQAPCARFLFGDAGGLTTAPHLPQISALSTVASFTGIPTYSVPVLRVGRIFVQNNAFATLRVLSEARFTVSTPKPIGVTAADTLLTMGGYLAMFDGVYGTIEHGFFMGPENLACTPAAAGGAVADGVYQHVAFYEWTDMKGRLHRSSVSPPVSSTVSGGGGAGKIQVVVPTLRVTLKDPGSTNFNRSTVPRIVIGRTEAGGKIFYRTNGTPASVSISSNDTLTYQDVTSNATLITQEIVYTTGGELDNFTPNGQTAICQSPERVFVADDSSVYFSKPIKPGVAVSFAQEFSVSIPGEDGPILGLAYMDGRVYCFTRNQVWSFNGDGPDATGGGGAYSVPERLKTDGGCLGQQALVNVPQGIIVQTQNGFYMLGRDESWLYIGGAVRDYNSFPCYSAQIYPLRKEVRFALRFQPTLIYNYEWLDERGIGQWFTSGFKARDSAMVECAPVSLSGTTDLELYYALNETNAGFYVESSNVFTDDTLGNYNMVAGCGWIATSMIQGFQRVKKIIFLGEWLNDATTTITIAIAYDFEDFSETHSISAQTVSPGTLRTMQFAVQPKRQKCESIRVKVTVNATGAGINLTAMSLKVGLKPQMNKLPAFRRAP